MKRIVRRTMRWHFVRQFPPTQNACMTVLQSCQLTSPRPAIPLLKVMCLRMGDFINGRSGRQNLWVCRAISRASVLCWGVGRPSCLLQELCCKDISERAHDAVCWLECQHRALVRTPTTIRYILSALFSL